MTLQTGKDSENVAGIFDFMCTCGHGRWVHYGTLGEGRCAQVECKLNNLCKKFQQAPEHKQ